MNFAEQRLRRIEKRSSDDHHLKMVFREIYLVRKQHRGGAVPSLSILSTRQFDKHAGCWRLHLIPLNLVAITIIYQGGSGVGSWICFKMVAPSFVTTTSPRSSMTILSIPLRDNVKIKFCFIVSGFARLPRTEASADDVSNRLRGDHVPKSHVFGVRLIIVGGTVSVERRI